MLSYIYRLVRNFEQQHGIYPNLLYLNDLHVCHLKAGLDEHYSFQAIRELLQMEIVVSKETVHPHVAWSPAVHKKVG